MSAYREPAPREEPAAAPRAPVDWARVGGALIAVGGCGLMASVGWAIVMLTANVAGTTGAQAAIASVWIALFAAGLPLAICAKGKAFPHL